MADIDTSSYPKPKETNPLQTLGGIANLQNTLNQNKLFQQQFQTNKAVSDIVKRAMKPDGTLDMGEAMDEVSKNPAAAYGLMDVFKGAQGLQQGQIKTNSDQIDLARKNIDIMGSYMTPLESKVDKDGKPNATKSDVMASVAQAILSGHVDPKVIGPFIADLPDDNSLVPAWIKQKHLQFLDTQSRFNAMHPTPTMQNIPGGGVAPFVMPQSGQVQQVGDTIQPAPAPTTTTVGPDGTPRYIGNPQGNNPYEAAYQQSQGRGAPAPGGIAPGGNIGGLPASLSPAASAALSDTGHASSQAYASLKNDVGSSATRIFQLNKALTGLQGAPTGPGTETVNHISSFLQAQAPEALKRFLPGVDVTQIKNRDEADKYLTAFASGQAGSFAPNTNEKLATALSANASTHISNLAAQDVVKANIGLERMKQAEAIAFQNSGIPAEKFSDWAVNWNKGTDPRAFIADQMSKKDRTDMINAMKPSEKTTFLNSVQSAIATGLVSLSDLRNGK